MAHFIGRPTHFVSHAHTYKADDLIGALQTCWQAGGRGGANVLLG